MLVVALIVQLVLGAGLILVAVNGFPLIGNDSRPNSSSPNEASAAIACRSAIVKLVSTPRLISRSDAP